MQRNLFRIIVLIAVTAGLVACNMNDRKISGWEINDVYHGTIITPNPMGSGKIYQGPPINTMDDSNTYEMYSLRMNQTQQGQKNFELVAQLTYFTKWRYYDSATQEGTPATSFKVVGREAGACGERGCIFREVLSIQIPESFLKDRSSKGFIVTISSQSGVSSNLFVPPQYIQGYMQAVKGAN